MRRGCQKQASLQCSHGAPAAQGQGDTKVSCRHLGAAHCELAYGRIVAEYCSGLLLLLGKSCCNSCLRQHDSLYDLQVGLTIKNPCVSEAQEK